MRRKILTHALLLALALGAGAATARAAGPPATRLIQLVLLEGQTQGPANLETLPENVRPAVDDVRGFLPFRSYELLDIALVRTNRTARTSLAGPGGTEYQIRAVLLKDPTDEGDRVGSFDIVKIVRGLTATGEEAPLRADEVLSTSFAFEVGKTVVVGTSRLSGGESALIALFTAVR